MRRVTVAVCVQASIGPPLPQDIEADILKLREQCVTCHTHQPLPSCHVTLMRACGRYDKRREAEVEYVKQQVCVCV